MAKVMGTVKSIIGEATATAADGSVRKLQVGDQVFTDDVISTSALGSVQIALAGGQTVECSGDASIAMNDFVIGAGLNVALAAAQETPPAAPPAADIAAIQAAIAAGADPSQVAEATAAGGAPGAGGAEGGGGRSIVVLEQGNESQVVSAGFSTEGAGIGFPTPEFELLPETESPPLPVPVVSVSVEVRVDVDDPESPGGGSGGPVVGGNALSIIEGTNGDQPPKIVNFLITLDQPFDQDVQVTYQIVPGTAQTPEDFTGVLIGTVTIPAGQTQFVVSVEIVQDHIVEGNETFSIVLIDAVNATINPDANSAVVTIVDDDTAPVANADTNWVQEDEVVEASGNVLVSQSHTGAPSGSFGDAADTDEDGDTLTVTTTGSFGGDYGTLVLNADGSYTYTLNSSLPAVQGLSEGETLTDEFSYTVTDGHNDPATATLTITIFGTDDGVTITGLTAQGADHTVFESDLSGGSSPNAGALTQAGSFNIEAKDGISTVQVGGVTLTLEDLLNLGSPSVTVSSAYGDLVLNGYTPGATGGGQYGGTVSYQYTLNTNVDNDSQPGATDTEYADAFTVIVTDKDGSFDSATLTVVIVDDVPSAVDYDAGQITEGSGETILGNAVTVLGISGGADGVMSIVFGAGSQGGTLHIDGDGNLVYTAPDSVNNAEGDVTETFSFTVSDNDEDTVTKTVTVAIADGQGPGDADLVTLAVQEAEITDTAQATLSFTVSSDPLASFAFDFSAQTLAGITADINGNSIDDLVWEQDGVDLIGKRDGVEVLRLTLSDADLEAGTVQVKVSLTGALPHEGGDGMNVATITGIKVIATDTDGTSATGSVTVQVTDDVPSLSAITNAVVANESGLTITGYHNGDTGADVNGQYSIEGLTQIDGLFYYTFENPDGTATLVASTTGGQSPANPGDVTNQYFVIQVNNDGTYDLTLVTERPVVEFENILVSTPPSIYHQVSIPHNSADPEVILDGLLFASGSGGGDSAKNFSNTDVNGERLNVNSAGGFGVGQSQIDDDEGFLAFVKNGADSFQFDLTRVGGGAASTIVITWAAYLGDEPVAGQTPDEFGSITINFSGAGTQTVVLDPSITFDYLVVRFDVSGGGNHRVENVGYTQEVIPSDQQLEFNVTLIDADGDTVSSAFAVQLSGGAPGGDDMLAGTDGNDVMHGGAGNDILVGGAGDDILTGGLGNDTFKWLSGDQGTAGTPAVDTITDWTNGNNVLHLADLLQGENATAASLDAYLDFVKVGSDTRIDVRPSGGGDVTQQIVLQGVDLTAGNTLTDQQIIQTLLDSNKLVIG